MIRRYATDCQTVRELKDKAEYGPKNPTYTDKIRGWRTTDGYYVCAHCAARILGRGCQLPQETEPVWKDSPEPFGVCCVCDDEPF